VAVAQVVVREPEFSEPNNRLLVPLVADTLHARFDPFIGCCNSRFCAAVVPTTSEQSERTRPPCRTPARFSTHARHHRRHASRNAPRRIHHPQILQAEIGHGARRRPYIRGCAWKPERRRVGNDVTILHEWAWCKIKLCVTGIRVKISGSGSAGRNRSRIQAKI